MTFIEFLVKDKVIDKKKGVDLEKEVKTSSKAPEEIILEEQLIPEDKLFEAKSRFLDIPFKKVLPESIPPDVLSVIPKEAVDFYKMVPLNIDQVGGDFEVGMVNPDNVQAKQALRFLARQHKLTPKVFLISYTGFNQCLNKYQGPQQEMQKALKRLEQEMQIGEKRKNKLKKQDFERIVDEAPVIKMVAVILRQAVEGNASDIHIEPSKDSTRVRFRFDGMLYHSLTLPAKIHPAIIARIKILSGLKIDETRLPQDGRFSTIVAEKRIDFRVATFPTTTGEKVVLRVLNPAQGLEKLEDLGFYGRNLRLIRESIKKPHGMILVTGPTGSGKSTTLYTILKMLNKEEVNIVTLEDPVEYFVNGVSQSQVRPDIKYTFSKGLRHILRQDPDIIMVGEIRDEETASLAIHAALTGHLVLSTLHTNNAPGVVPRLVDMGIKSFLLAPSLNLAVSQRLVRALCPACKEKVKATGSAKRYILDKIKGMPQELKTEIRNQGSFYVFKAKGCKKCNSKGYSGRIGIFEVLEMTDALSDIIATEPTEQAIFKEARRQGMATMEEDGMLKVLEGVTSLEEIMRISEEQTE